ncbi:hypothetical protein ABVK25_002372 [Lepraria finkii]|uniref:Secreted protein n=1 Tax=Lepraria finkii TaxID=1340010 RepID=A0ABR4BKP3_9LECA
MHPAICLRSLLLMVLTAQSLPTELVTDSVSRHANRTWHPRPSPIGPVQAQPDGWKMGTIGRRQDMDE